MKTKSIICLAVILTFIYSFPLQAKEAPVKAMWVWDYYKSAFTQDQREELIRFSLDNGINRLLVGTRGTLRDHFEEYADLIQRAHANGIRVFALAGKGEWALKENHSTALKHIEEVLDFNSSRLTNRFDGISLDIEPHTLSGYSENAGSIGYQFMRLLEATVTLISENGGDLELDVAVPFWYSSGDRPRTIEYNGVRKSLSYHILDLVDSVTIMAYRNNADAQIKVSENDIEYAGNLGKKAYVGAETMPPDSGKIPVEITYYDNKTGYMNDQLEAVNQYYSNHSGYGGIAIHSYESFKEMRLKDKRSLEQQFSFLKAAGIMTGYADGSAGFEKTATRAEAAAIAARIGGYTTATLYQPVLPSFYDVPKNAWYYGWVESAYKMGVIQGKGDGRFDPNFKITMEEALIMMARTTGLSKIEGAAIPDASVWSHGWIQMMINEGLSDQRRNYTKEITREELVPIVYNTFMLHMKK